MTITLTEYESPFCLSRSFPKKQQMAVSIQLSAYTFALALATDIIHFYVRKFLRYSKWVVMGLFDAKTVIHRPDI